MSNRVVTIDISAPVRLSELPALARQVWDWWIGELIALAPAWLRQMLPEPPKVATLVVTDDRWRVVPGGSEISGFDLDPSADDQGLAHQIVQAAPSFSLQRLRILLPRSMILRRRMRLPLMADADLRAAVELQIDRLSPFAADAARFDVRVLSRDRVEGTIDAEAAIAPRAGIEAIERRLAALGLMPVAIDAAGDDDVPLGFDLRAAKEGGRSRQAVAVSAGFAVAALFSLYLASVAWTIAREREVEAWQARIAELRPSAQRSAALRQQLDAMAQPFAMARAHRPGQTLGVIKELTALLPDTARLTELRLTGGAVDLTGLATDAPALVAKLEASKVFADVKFRSPVTRRPELNKERFEMSLRVEGVTAR